MARAADAAVGSALVERLAAHLLPDGSAGPDLVAAALGDVRRLAAPVRGARAAGRV